MKHLILYSGGLDSFITVQYVKHVVMSSTDTLDLVYVPLGHRYQHAELSAVQGTYPDTKILVGLRDLGSIEELDANIWNRNAFLCILSAKHMGAEYGKLWLTVQKDELSLPDRSPVFFKSISDLLISLGTNVFVDTPWWNFDKTEMVEWYLRSGGSIKMLKKTRSCYSVNDIPCGSCAACVRRFIAMKLNNIDEEYGEDPMQSETGKKYVERAKSGMYSTERCNKTLIALGVSNET